MGYIHHQFKQELTSDIQILRLSPKALSNYQDFLPPDFSTEGQGKYIFLGATHYDQPCGLLIAGTQEQCELVHIQVDESVQHTEVGSRLVMALQRSVSQLSPSNHIYVSIPVKEEEDLTPFFSVNGFTLRGTASQAFSFSLSALAENEGYHKLDSLTPLADTYPLLSMPGSAWMRFSQALGTTIPQELSPELVPGELLPQYSLAYLYRGEVSAYVIFSKLSEETVYLAVSYAKPKHAARLMNLLKQAFDAILAEPGTFTTMEIATMNEKSLRLVEHFIGSDAPQVSRSSLQLMSWSVEDVRTMETNRIIGQMDLMQSQGLEGDVSFLLPRTLRLSDLLEARGYTPALTAVGDLPGLLFEMDGYLTTMTYSYADGGRSACQLSVILRIPSTLEGDALSLCLDLFNRASLSAVALSMENHTVALRDNYLEIEAPISETSLDAFLTMVSQSALNLHGLV